MHDVHGVLGTGYSGLDNVNREKANSHGVNRANPPERNIDGEKRILLS